MKTYIRIEEGVVRETILPATDEDDNEIPIDRRFTPEFVSTLVELPEGQSAPPDNSVAELVDGEWVFSQP